MKKHVAQSKLLKYTENLKCEIIESVREKKSTTTVSWIGKEKEST